MAAIIDSKEIECGEEALVQIADFVGPHIDKNIPATIKIMIQRHSEKRHHKMTARDTLQRLLDGNELSYRRFKYDFNFNAEKYCWKGKKIYLTVGEALFLYKYLILNQFEHSQMYFIYNIRKRYGKEFLQEVIHA